MLQNEIIYIIIGIIILILASLYFLNFYLKKMIKKECVKILKKNVKKTLIVNKHEPVNTTNENITDNLDSYMDPIENS